MNSRIGTGRKWGRGLASLALGGLLASSLGACSDYVTVGQGDTQYASANPNTANVERVTMSAVSYVLARYPIRLEDPTVALNLPAGTRQNTYARICREVGPNVRPLTPELAASRVPIVHVSRVWIRAEEATVDVVRPLVEGGLREDGTYEIQEFRVKLRGGLNPWSVVYCDARPIGLAAAPELYYIPGTDNPNEFRDLRLARQREHDAMMRERALAAQRERELRDAGATIIDPSDMGQDAMGLEPGATAGADEPVAPEPE